jgi:hypothetical protein
VHLKGVEEMKEEPETLSYYCDDNIRAKTKPQTWQYLTDAEIREIIGSNGDGIGGYTRELFDKIEAKVREKNEREPKENN